MFTPTILCLTDFGRAGNDALQQATFEAEIRDARLHVLHVHRSDEDELDDCELFPKHQIESDLRVATQSLDCQKLTVEVRIGEPIDEVAAVINELEPDLVVLGAHQSSKSTDQPAWDTSPFITSILQMSRCPVLVCRGPAKISNFSAATDMERPTKS